MIITFKVLKFKNLLSFGAQETVIEFSKGINLISGKNGSGKCLEKSTKLNIKINDENMLKFWNNYINI